MILADMRLDDLKKTFVQKMEEIHSPEGYPRNFFGCLAALMIEDGSVTQDRIIELTHYSRTTVSLTLQKLPLLLPVRVSKKGGDRKHYYSYNGSIDGLLVEILRRRNDEPDIDLDLIQDITHKIEPFVIKAPSYTQFHQYLTNLDFFIRFLSARRNEFLEHFESYLASEDINEQGDSARFDEINAEFLMLLKNIMARRREIKECPFSEQELIPHYVDLKREYFQGILNTFNPIYSKVMANLLIVVHDILIEECTTQVEIQQATQLPRSTISECLSLAVAQNLIQIKRTRGSRTKYYQPKLSLTAILVRYYDRAIRYTVQIKNFLSDLIVKASEVVLKDKELDLFVQKLNTLLSVYTLAQKTAQQTKFRMMEEILKSAENMEYV